MTGLYFHNIHNIHNFKNIHIGHIVHNAPIGHNVHIIHNGHNVYTVIMFILEIMQLYETLMGAFVCPSGRQPLTGLRRYIFRLSKIDKC